MQSHDEIVRSHTVQITEHSKQIAEHSVQIGQLRDLLLRTARIVEAQGRQTDDRISALIAIVERYLSNGRK